MAWLQGFVVSSLLLACLTAEHITIPANRLVNTLKQRETLAEHYWPSGLPVRYAANLADSVCVAQSLLARFSIEPWSIQMWDSSGTSIVGHNAGAHQARGHQELCTNVHQTLPGTLYQQIELLPHHSKISSVLDTLHPLALNMSAPAINGRYCVVSVRSRSDASQFSAGSSELLGTFSNHNSPNYASCVPDTCSEDLLAAWVQRIEGHATKVDVKCTSQATILAIDSSELTFAVQPPTHYAGSYYYLTNGSKNNNSRELFVTVDTNEMSTGTLIFITFAAFLLFICASATAIDYLQESQPSSSSYDAVSSEYRSTIQSGPGRDSPQHQLRQSQTITNNNHMNLQTIPYVYGWETLQCFSIPQNWQRLFPKQRSANAMPVIDGLRCVSMCWVIIVHRYMMMLITSSHPKDLLKNRENPNYWWLFNAYPSVDIFFVISGFCLALSPMPRVSLKNIVNTYILRYLRFAPAVIMTVWGVSTAFVHLSSGPMWNMIYDGLFGRPCQKSWLSSIFLISNVNDANDMCMGHLWSLSIDWQMSLVGTLVFLPLMSKGSFVSRYLPLIILTIVTIIAPGLVSLRYNLPPLPSIATLKRSLDFYNQYYISTICRASPYCIGLLAGRLHLWLKDHPEALTQHIVGLGHAVAMAAVSGVLISPLMIDSYNVQLSALHNALAKPIFAVALAFLIITSYHEKGGIFGWLLSRPVAGMLARCSYCIYIISLPMQVWASVTSATIPSEGIVQAYMCGGDLIVSIFCGIVLALTVEMPFARILGNFLKKKNPKGSRSTSLASQKTSEKHVDQQDLRECFDATLKESQHSELVKRLNCLNAQPCELPKLDTGANCIKCRI